MSQKGSNVPKKTCLRSINVKFNITGTYETVMHLRKYMLFWTIFTAATTFFLAASTWSASGIIIIANKNVRENRLEAEELRSIFLGEQSVWSDEKRINFAVLRKGKTHTDFLETFIQKTPKNFVRYWKRQIMTGKAVIPKLAMTEAEVIEYVATTEGAIGYVSAISDDSGLKVIDIVK